MLRFCNTNGVQQQRFKNAPLVKEQGPVLVFRIAVLRWQRFLGVRGNEIGRRTTRYKIEMYDTYSLTVQYSLRLHPKRHYGTYGTDPHLPGRIPVQLPYPEVSFSGVQLLETQTRCRWCFASVSVGLSNVKNEYRL